MRPLYQRKREEEGLTLAARESRGKRGIDR